MNLQNPKIFDRLKDENPSNVHVYIHITLI